MAVSDLDKEKGLNLEVMSFGDITWVYIQRPTPKEIQYLADNYHFHSLDLEDCVTRLQRPKIDEYPGYLFFVFQFPRFNEKKELTTLSQLSVFIGDKFLVTVQDGNLESLHRLYSECQTNGELGQACLGQGTGYLLYRILDKLVDYTLPIVDKMLAKMEEIEDNVFDEDKETARDLANLRRNVITQRRVIWQLRAVMGDVGNKVQRYSRVEMKAYFGDLVDHLDRVWDILEESKEITEVFKDTDFILSNDHLNRIMRILTILTAVTLPFAIISSIYGMNVPLPGGGVTEGHPMAYVVIFIVMALITGSMLFVFHRKRWL
jgi:magnesium transporter